VLETLGEDGEEVCGSVGIFVSQDDDDVETIDNVSDGIAEKVDKELVDANVLSTVERLEIISDAVEKSVVDDCITDVNVVAGLELKLEKLLLARLLIELKTLLVAVLDDEIDAELKPVAEIELGRLDAVLYAELERLDAELEGLDAEPDTEVKRSDKVLETVAEIELDRLDTVLETELGRPDVELETVTKIELDRLDTVLETKLGRPDAELETVAEIELDRLDSVLETELGRLDAKLEGPYAEPDTKIERSDTVLEEVAEIELIGLDTVSNTKLGAELDCVIEDTLE
jgi:hypothetical protein